MTLRLLHFADAHIDMANYGRHDPDSGLPVRVVDFLQAFDQIIDRAIDEQVDLVIFAGDAYKDRNPQPTFQKAWGERMMRLSAAGIPTLLLVGNHDMTPAQKRAHTLQEFKTLQVPQIHVADTLRMWTPDDLGIPVQIISLPWVTRSRFMTRAEAAGKSTTEIVTEIEETVSDAILQMMDEADPTIPLILTAHASVSGATYGSERNVIIGQELVLSRRIVEDQRLDYVALGHIHKHQVLNHRPPVIYSGSIERIDFGESKEEKGFVLAELKPDETNWQFVPLDIRPYLDLQVEVRQSDDFMATIMNQLPPSEKAVGAVCRVTIIFPQDLEPLLDEKQITDHFNLAFDLRIHKKRMTMDRSRLGDSVAVESMGPAELLSLYWQTKEYSAEETAELENLAGRVLGPYWESE